MGEINWKNKCWVTTIYLVNDKKEVLLNWNKNLQAWIPVGGHIEQGETPEEAVIREVQEETGFSFEFLNKAEVQDNGKLRVLKPSHIQIEEVPHHNHHMNIVFFGKCTKYNERAETDEQEKLKWFSRQELLDNKSSIFESVFSNSIKALDSFE